MDYRKLFLMFSRRRSISLTFYVVLTLSCLLLFLCPGWSNFIWIKATCITMKCTYLHNHSICFNLTLHQLGKQLELSSYTGKSDGLWPTSRSRDPIRPPNPLFKCQNKRVIDHISKRSLDILLIYLIFFSFFATVMFSIKEARKLYLYLYFNSGSSE